MKMPKLTVFSIAIATAFALAGCATLNESTKLGRAAVTTLQQQTNTYDDLLTAGLDAAMLRNPVGPTFANPAAPTGAELRRRSIWSSWRGIYNVASKDLDAMLASSGQIPGREFSAIAQLAGSTSTHRVLTQVPDNFNQSNRCLIVAPSSGSRGVYGAISVAAPWGLPKGCAIAYTDKGTGSDYFDVDTKTGADLSGVVSSGDARVFVPNVASTVRPHEVAFKHAHSQQNPEADWGRFVVQAAEFGLASLTEAFPSQTPFTWENTRVIAVGISNGGGAVLRAAEEKGANFAAVVAGEPQIHVTGHNSVPLYDYSIEAATLMACAQLALPEDKLPQPPLLAQAKPLMGLWCQRLKMANVLQGNDVAAQSAEALQKLKARGWNDGAIAAGFASTGFDLWRSVLAGYVSAYAKAPVGANPCGFYYTPQDAEMTPRAATNAERAMWWTDSSGIPTGAGVNLRHDNPDIYAQVQCLAEKRNDPTVTASINATLGHKPADDKLPVFVVHGKSDGLVPIHYSSIPYVEMVRASGHSRISFWQIENAQHFDAFLAFPGYGDKFVPLLPHVYKALDAAWSTATTNAPMPTDVN